MKAKKPSDVDEESETSGTHTASIHLDEVCKVSVDLGTEHVLGDFNKSIVRRWKEAWLKVIQKQVKEGKEDCECAKTLSTHFALRKRNRRG